MVLVMVALFHSSASKAKALFSDCRFWAARFTVTVDEVDTVTSETLPSAPLASTTR
jgi:hypothetical protein